MSRIDYSKWDNLDEYSDDDNDGDIGNSDDGMTPRVTRLDGPSKVTFGGGSSSSSNTATTTPLINIEPTSSSLYSSSCRNSSDDKISTATTKLSLTPNNEENSSSSWTERGGLVESESTTIVVDGNPQKRKLYWSQDRYSVTLRLELLLHGHNNNNNGEEEEEEKREKIQSVDVDGILPFSDRHCATGSTRPVLRCQGIITNANNNNNNNTKVIGVNKNNNNNIDPNNLVLLLEGELPHPVYIAEDDDEDVDWSVVQDESSRRFLMITLYKAVPMQGIFVWWRRPMMHFPELDLQQVKDDPTTTTPAVASSAAAGSTIEPAAASQDFLKSWEEAHKIFREEKMKKKKRLV
ncbi:hypothetical protein FRACYDRAFT_241234 [Fragilariopsis cylindrus CCMP1102]|uniref:CS domain-containing protein n=1 Tax=Fragilariopsis cylindrus CCMP1102 TaxID=635003 RepID=A0A1E7F939_9STRA|nr:hypothetical protein FRACYDRAFT_241234 [Fragilariopsis cylindrus CCMP1102]|eukprot:OEU14682.1 hypothetical protein FRACYDRAFT_241234 [Fragilariopsis cylindrus CCMP1102]